MRKVHKPSVCKNDEPESPLMYELQDLQLLVIPKALEPHIVNRDEGPSHPDGRDGVQEWFKE